VEMKGLWNKIVYCSEFQHSSQNTSENGLPELGSGCLPKALPLHHFTELIPICHLVALLGAHHILHVSKIRVNVKGQQLWRNWRYCRGICLYGLTKNIVLGQLVCGRGL